MNPLNLWKALIAHGYKEAAAGLLADLIGDLLTAEALAPPNVEQRFGEMTRGYLSDVLQDAGDGHRVAVFVDAFCRDRGEFDRLSHSHAAEMIEGFEQLKP